MKHLTNTYSLMRTCCISLALVLLCLLSGCDEANVAIDSILGRRTPVLSAAPHGSSSPLIPAKMRVPGEKSPAPEGEPAVERPAPQAAQPAPAQAAVPKGKKREPGQMPPAAEPNVAEKAPIPEAAKPPSAEEALSPPRDPFKQPTEILPSECPPSMPLCRFDRSQLKLVGVIQVSDGQYKGLVEDPDGRGYFVSAGMMIYGATVTQVNNRGMVLRLHKDGADVPMPLSKGEVKESD